MIQQLVDHSYPKLSKKEDSEKSYDYLTNITIFALTDEERTKLKDEYSKKFDELEIYKNTTIQQIWLRELDTLEETYKKWLIEQKEESDKANKGKKKPVKKTKGKTK